MGEGDFYFFLGGVDHQLITVPAAGRVRRVPEPVSGRFSGRVSDRTSINLRKRSDFGANKSSLLLPGCPQNQKMASVAIT